MFDLTIVDEENGSMVCIDDLIISNCDKQKANFWRCVDHADKVFVGSDVAISFGENPSQLVVFRITQEEMERFLSRVMYTYDHLEHTNHVGWVEIDPSLQGMFKSLAEDIIESSSMWLDEDPLYPKDTPFILIHPERDTRTGEAFIELMYIYMESAPVEKTESVSLQSQ